MRCAKCGADAPGNVLGFRNTQLLCEGCTKKKIKLTDELREIYYRGIPGRYVYVSDLTNNLDKISRFFKEEVHINNPYCTITLVTPDALSELYGQFDGVYVDKDIAHTATKIPLFEFGYVKNVEPSYMEVLS